MRARRARRPGPSRRRERRVAHLERAARPRRKARAPAATQGGHVRTRTARLAPEARTDRIAWPQGTRRAPEDSTPRRPPARGLAPAKSARGFPWGRPAGHAACDRRRASHDECSTASATSPTGTSHPRVPRRRRRSAVRRALGGRGRRGLDELGARAKKSSAEALRRSIRGQVAHSQLVRHVCLGARSALVEGASDVSRGPQSPRTAPN